MVECQLPKLKVASSNLVSRSNAKAPTQRWVLLRSNGFRTERIRSTICEERQRQLSLFTEGYEQRDVEPGIPLQRVP